MAVIAGRCHCGNVEISLETRIDPRQLPLRACQCSFCRRHGARTTADPAGRAAIKVRDVEELSRYRWGLATADFLVCRRCGVYLGALLSEGGRGWATLNANAFDDQEPFRREAEPVSYEGETAEQRIARRKSGWTPSAEVQAAMPCGARHRGWR
ncbi:MAG: aldehyde-activating protein [Deltaproteobacteria bacterium]|nr:MAG: aldehyde-activating protein [Deltaproteobacteria bacterium]